MKDKCSEKEGPNRLIGIVVGEDACESVEQALSSQNPSENTYLRILKFLGDYHPSAWNSDTLVRNFKEDTRNNLELMVRERVVKVRYKNGVPKYSLTNEGYYLYETVDKRIDWKG